MSETGLYDVFETPSGKFRRWQTTGTVECMNGGVWRSIPEVAQAEIVRLRAALRSIEHQCGNVIFNGERERLDHKRHIDSWKRVRDYACTAIPPPPKGETP